MDEYTSINISKIKAGMLFWECGDGQDALFIATRDAQRDGNGISVLGREIPGGAVVRFFEGDRGGAYGPRLYPTPQYTRPDWPALLIALAKVMQEMAAEATSQAKAREDGLSLAATQYSESRDTWMLKAKEAAKEIERLQGVLTEVGDIATRNLNGITMGQRIRHVLEQRDRP